jgi:formylmethanofuran dehydrogenase subunit E
LLPGALDEYDRTCQAHDNEMETICEAFRKKWAKIPLLETYRQMAIRQQKQKNWRACLWWAERGLHFYGNNPAREDAVEDLVKRRNRALSKLEISSTSESERPNLTRAASVSNITSTDPSPGLGESMFEVLICTRCQESFQRTVVRGRKPLLCPDCRTRSA